jgi:hypothetical protein
MIEIANVLSPAHQAMAKDGPLEAHQQPDDSMRGKPQ